MKTPSRIFILCTTILILTGLLAAPSPAASAPTTGTPDGWYLGGTIGQSNVDAARAEDGSDTSLRFFGGYRFADFFALETGYADLGDIDLRPSDVAEVFPAKIKASGWTLAAIGRVPVGAGFAVEGRLGAFFWDGNAKVPGVDTNAGDIHPQFGLGVSWDASNHIALTADWTHYDLTGLNTNIFSLGLRIHLRRAAP